MLMSPISAAALLMAGISGASAERSAARVEAPVVIPESTPEKTAPEPLRLVQRFINSTEIHETQPTDEELASPEALRDWLAERDLMDAPRW